MYDLYGRNMRAFGKRRRDAQQGHVLLTPSLAEVLVPEEGARYKQRFECAHHSQSGTVTVATARRLYLRGSSECSTCCHRQRCETGAT